MSSMITINSMTTTISIDSGMMVFFLRQKKKRFFTRSFSFKVKRIDILPDQLANFIRLLKDENEGISIEKRELFDIENNSSKEYPPCFKCFFRSHC